VPRALNASLMQLQRRAESSDREFLSSSFVDVGPLFGLLSSANQQVIFGRRGTGKTHAMLYLADWLRAQGEIVVEVDLRTAGAVGSYSAANQDQRATGLLVDVLGMIHSSLTDLALAAADHADVPQIPLSPLDDLAEAATTVRIVGPVEIETKRSEGSQEATGVSAGLGLGLSGAGAHIDIGAKQTESVQHDHRILERGATELEIHFGRVHEALRRIANPLAPRRLWLIIDEWSSVPVVLQPLLADLIRRCFLAVPNIVVKIAAIEDRTAMRIPTGQGDYVGIELGSDVTADINLDRFLIFSHNPDNAIEFFSTLFFRHVSSAHGLTSSIKTPRQFVVRAFRDQGTFSELVRSASGIARDAINVAALAAQYADEDSIRLTHLREAARDWYQRDKQAPLRNTPAATLLQGIVREVVGVRQQRAFLLRQGRGGRATLSSDNFTTRG
jgi:hypothetical protein